MKFSLSWKFHSCPLKDREYFGLQPVLQPGKRRLRRYPNSLQLSAPALFHPNGEYWLYDDVKVDDLGGNLGEFTGKLDGAFNTITYKFGNVEGGETGLFSKLNQATVENLKIKDSEINATTLTSDLKVGALASRIENSTLKNVEVKNFKLSVQNEGASKVQVGSLAGEIKGDNSFHNVNAVNLEVEGASNAVKGSLVGSVESGNHKVTGLSFG